MLALITFLGPLSLHIFFPAAPAVKTYFQTDDFYVQLTASAPMFAMAFMTLVFGPLSDRFGRRRVLLAGILMFSIGGLLAAAADSIWTLIAGRLIQAAGGACGLTLARAIARDIYGTDQLVKIVAYLTMAYTIGPITAPPIGGFLVEYWGWRSVLIFAASAGLALVVLAYFTIAESRPKESPDAPKRSFFAGFLTLLGNIRFSAFSLQTGASTGAFFAMASGTAYIMTEYLGRPASDYGLFFPLMPIGYWLGSLVSSRLSGRVDIETMVFGASGLMLVATSLFAGLMFAGHINPWTIFLPGALLTFGQGLNTPNVQAGLLGVSQHLAGTAAGIGVFSQMFGGGLLSQIYGATADGTPLPLAQIVLTATIVSLIAGAVPYFMKRARSLDKQV